MHVMFECGTRLRADESGASAAEYGILVALVAGIVVLAIGTFGNGLNTVYTNLGAYLATLIP
jgi:pilus assembly protein Flp/PilA